LIGGEVLGGAEPRYRRYRSYSEETTMEGNVLDDLFSLGSLFYEILIGTSPFADTDTSEIFQLFKAHVFPSLDDICPESYVQAISKCWNEEYESILDLKTSLELIKVDVGRPKDDYGTNRNFI